jgi:hypothetical protein
VVATEAMTIGGIAAGQRVPNGVFSVGLESGDGGRISVTTPLLTMGSAGMIDGSTFARSSGNAGRIEVRAGRVTLTSGARIRSSTAGSGRGGAVTVAATETMTMAGVVPGGGELRELGEFESGRFSSTVGRGPGGNVRVTAPHIQLSDGGTISARSAIAFAQFGDETGQPLGPPFPVPGSGGGEAGSVLIQARETFRSQHGRVITSAVETGGGRDDAARRAADRSPRERDHHDCPGRGG